MPRKLSGLHPTWKYNSHGARSGVQFICPKCAPSGSCEITVDWGDVPQPPGENVENLEHFKSCLPLKASSDDCTILGSITDGVVNYS